MLNEKLIKDAEMLMRARATYYSCVDGELSPERRLIYEGMGYAYENAAAVLRDALNDNADALNMKWAGYEKYDPRLLPFEMWEVPHENWPREGDFFRVGRHVGRCVRFIIDYENTSATAWMRVEG